MDMCTKLSSFIGILGGFAAAATALAIPLEGIAAGRALLVAAEQYDDPGIADLTGPGHDIHDLDAALAIAGFEDRRIIDKERLTKTAVIDAFRDLIAKSTPGDTLFFAYSGHGLQIPDLNGDEADGMDEVMVMPQFQLQTPSIEDMITDDELDGLIKKAAPRTVIVVMDSCHSGTAVRAVDQRIDPPPTRYIPQSSLSGPVRTVIVGRGSSESSPGKSFRSAENLLFIGAVDDAFEIQEISVRGQWRGALSYAVAQAMRGSADLNSDGTISTSEFSTYVTSTVRKLTAGRQEPISWITPGLAEEFAWPAPNHEILAAKASVRRPEILTIGDHWLGFDLSSIEEVKLKKSGEADLVVDVRNGDVLTRQGDLLASLGPDVKQTTLQSVVDKWRLLSSIEGQIDPRIKIRLSDGDRVYKKNEKLKMTIDSDRSGSLILFDLAADGTVILISPRHGKPPDRIAAHKIFEIPLRIGPPYGADHLVAIVSDDLAPLIDVVQQAHGRGLNASAATQLLRSLNRHKVNFTPLFTTP